MNITFRTQLLGTITDFCQECGLEMATPEILVDLIARLSNYREEGSVLAPQVYLTDNIDLLVKMLPDGEKITISATTPNTRGVGEILKICAPLATEEWRIFIQRIEDEMKFGLYRGSSNPLSTAVDEILLSKQEEAMVIKVHNIADQCVELRSSKRHIHYIYFNHRKHDSPPPFQHIEDFVNYAVRRINGRDREPIFGLIKNILTNALLESHGCILAVTNMKQVPYVLSRDAILLEDPIDFPSMLNQLKQSKGSSLSLQFIEKRKDLLKGMIASDGITLFDENGRVLAYRCFVSPSDGTTVIGGARRRAFETLRKHLGRGLSAVFIQSQDGWTAFEDVEHE